ncbi:hypothetical protein [Chlorogloeopsis sp. ULAP02]|uniref:hypothetical protein n=1 Tax=Chlorogloeopsis sp. ULAP02 TaxID=3107926 RepID=UPI0031353BC0
MGGSAPLGVPPVVAPGVGLSASSAIAMRVEKINSRFEQQDYQQNPHAAVLQIDGAARAHWFGSPTS